MSTLLGTIHTRLLGPSEGRANKTEFARNEFQIDTGYLQAHITGPSDTHSVSQTYGGGSVFVGLPLSVSDSSSVRIRQAEEAGIPQEGHFVKMVWDDNKVVFTADPLGVRTCYFVHVGDVVHFSTDLSEVCQRTGKHEIRQSAFASHWLGINQLSHACLVLGVERLAPGETLTITADGIDRATTGFSSFGRPCERYLDALIPFLKIQNRKTSLGLSGGLDSRTLLALLHTNNVEFQLHSFGSEDHPDNQVSRAIADVLGVQRISFPGTFGSPDDILATIRQFASTHCAIAPASAGLRLSDYRALSNAGLAIVDGGFGEIGRCRFARRLRHPIFEKLTRFTSRHLSHALRFDRPHVFMPEIKKQLVESYRYTIRNLRHELRVGVDPWDNVVDRVMIDYRLPNFYSYGQSAIDRQGVGLMPFAQRRFLHALLNSPPGMRRDGKVYRQTIHRARVNLDRFPLAKGSAMSAFDGKKATSEIISPVATHPLKLIQEIVQDLVRSGPVRNFTWYDHHRLITSVDDFYSGDDSLENYVDWWLSFELWRQSLHS